MERERPPVLGLALTNLLAAHGWKAKELADATGLASSTISAYQTREGLLTRERLEWLATFMDEVDAAAVERAVFAATVAHPERPPARTPVDPTPEQYRSIDMAAALAGREAWEIAYQKLLRETWDENAALMHEQGRALATTLKKYSEVERRDLVEDAPDYQHWGLAFFLCEDSTRAAANDPDEALKLAELAVFVARHVPGADSWRTRFEGYCTGFLANAQKVANELLSAEETFACAWKSWQAGEDEAGLLSESRLLDLNASIKWANRRFDEALKLHEEALAGARRGEVGHLLLNLSATLEEKGDFEGSIEVLERAIQEIDGERQPRLLFGARFNRAANLVRLGRAQEAAPSVTQVRELAERMRNELDLIKTLWLEGNTLAGLGRQEEAIAALEQVGRDLTDRKLPFDHALASLDLALLYQKEGRLAEVRRLAAEMLRIFRALKVHREAIAALILFQDATEKGAVTEELVRRLQEYLVKARSNPELHFES